MSGTLQSLVIRLRQREAAGLLKYGTTVDRKDLSGLDWAVHAQEEAMDLCLYLERVRPALAMLDAAHTLLAKSTGSVEQSWVSEYERLFRGEKFLTLAAGTKETEGTK